MTSVSSGGCGAFVCRRRFPHLYSLLSTATKRTAHSTHPLTYAHTHTHTHTFSGSPLGVPVPCVALLYALPSTPRRREAPCPPPRSPTHTQTYTLTPSLLRAGHLEWAKPKDGQETMWIVAGIAAGIGVCSEDSVPPCLNTLLCSDPSPACGFQAWCASLWPSSGTTPTGTTPCCSRCS